jgi:cytochrome c oxidase subunit 4
MADNSLRFTSHHIVPVKTYTLVFIALLVLLALTVLAARIEHGVLNLVVGLSIAVTKAALIVLYFMHLRYNSFVVRMVAMAGVLWLAILITITMADYLTRS